MAHRNPNSPARTACAPYNFVPLPERVVTVVESADSLPDHNRFTNPGYQNSGYIEVELKTESPLYIRGPLTRREKRLEQAGKYISGTDQPVNAQNPDYRRTAKNKPDFFYVDPQTQQPVIPGSSLRGMICNVFEIITYSKFTRFSPRRIIYRSVGDTTSIGTSYRDKICGPNLASLPGMLEFDYPHSSVKGGYLFKDGDDWFIQPAAQTADGDSIVHVEQADVNAAGITVSMNGCTKIWIQSSSHHGLHARTSGTLCLNYSIATAVRSNAAPGYIPGYVIRTSRVGNGIPGVSGPKHMDCIVLEPDWLQPPRKVDPALISMYRNDCDDPTSRTRKLLDEYEATTHREGGRTIVPVFYKVDGSGELHYFGSTLMFRLPYDTTVSHCIPADLKLETQLDFADAVFGFIAKQNPLQFNQGQKGYAYASRVRVTDATLEANQRAWHLQDEPITPKLLASPKPTCFQHYLAQDQPEHRSTLVHYDDPTQMPLLRGQKQYWHHNRNWHDRAAAAAAITNDNANMSAKQKTYMRPLRGGVDSQNHEHDNRLTFRFRVYFDNLNNHELGALLWTLAPQDASGSGDGAPRYRHKLGMGKPYGMGSVSLRIVSCTMIDRQSRYRALFGDTDGWYNGAANLSAGEMDDKMRGFEKFVLEQLELDPATRLAQVRRVAMLLKMMQWPGQTVTAAQNGVRADQQQRSGNVRYMTISIPGGVPASQRNEYKVRPVLPDPTAWMTQDERKGATLVPEPRPSSEPVSPLPQPQPGKDPQPPVASPTIGDPTKDFPRYAVGDIIWLTISQEWHAKKRKTRTIYRADDSAIAYFNGNTPEVEENGQAIGKITSVEREKRKYAMTVKLHASQ